MKPQITNIEQYFNAMHDLVFRSSKFWYMLIFVIPAELLLGFMVQGGARSYVNFPDRPCIDVQGGSSVTL
jgi:hypothetical protein